MRIAFHTTLNAFDDSGISGDRRMARQLAGLLTELGHEVSPVRARRTWMAGPDAFEFARRRADAETQAEALSASWSAGAAPPALWFTYHHYYKAPDLLGPALSRRLRIPYVMAEASDAPGKLVGPWGPQAALAREALTAADVHLCFTGRDRAGLAAFLGEGAPLLELPPFIDLAGLPPTPARPPRDGAGPPHLVAMAMMRPGNKQESYLALAAALALIAERPWRLSLIGDGAGRGAIEAAFAPLGDRVILHGALARPEALALLAAGDLFVWPGLREAYGLVFLEAQALGLPIVAFRSGGVPDVVRPGDTALLAPAGDVAALAAAITGLLDDAGARRRMGEAAGRFVRGERGLGAARAILVGALARAVAANKERDR